jgi:hypothetical protein
MTGVDIGWEFGVALPLVFQYMKSFAQYPQH